MEDTRRDASILVEEETIVLRIDRKTLNESLGQLKDVLAKKKAEDAAAAKKKGMLKLVVVDMHLAE